MARNISIGELRQNPTQMLRDVKAGATYTITDHGEPVAQVAARQQPRWVPAEEINSLLRELGRDEAWERDIADHRAGTDAADPWEHG